MVGPKPEGISELMYQIRKFHGFLWASGGVFMDFLIHNIDECCWMKDAWPIKGKAQEPDVTARTRSTRTSTTTRSSIRSPTGRTSRSTRGRCPAAARSSPAMLSGRRGRQ